MSIFSGHKFGSVYVGTADKSILGRSVNHVLMTMMHCIAALFIGSSATTDSRGRDQDL